MKGGKPCGLAPWNDPPRYASNATNRKRFAGPPWNGTIPPCPSKKQLPPHRKQSSTPHRPKTLPPLRKRSSTLSTHCKQSSTFNPEEFPHFVVAHGKEIGRGRESVVYAFGDKAVKIFDSNFKRDHVQQNIDFLKQNKASGAVPIIYRSSSEYGWIEMELLTNYSTLKSSVKQKSRQYRTSLLDALVAARSKLSQSIEYKDMTNLGNIAVRHHHSGHPAEVKFIEGGRAVHYNDKLRGRQYIADMAAALNMKRYVQ